MVKKIILGLASISILTLGAAASSDIEIRQDAYFLTHGKYEKYLPDKFKKGTEIQEYQSPKGYGYQVIERENRADGIYWRSYGKGPESDSRSFDWTYLKPLATSTP